MTKQTPATEPDVSLLPTRIEGIDSLAVLAPNPDWSWNHRTDEVWRLLDPTFTPTSGLFMSTRSDPDPSLSPYLTRAEQITASQSFDMVNHHSGLLGVSEISPRHAGLARP